MKQEMVELNRYVCYIGRPSYQKNVLFFVDVANEVHRFHPEVKFLLLGVGYYSPDLAAVQAMISKYHLEDVVELQPWLTHAETLEYVRNSLLYLTVSRYEGLPLAVLEAMSLGKCIVASDVVGNRDCVCDGYNGRLLPLEKDVFAKSLSELIEDDTQRCKYGENSRKLFEEKFLIEKRINDLENTYRQIVDSQIA